MFGKLSTFAAISFIEKMCKVILAGAEYIKAKMDAAHLMANTYMKYKHLSRSADTERRLVTQVLTPKEAAEKSQRINCS